MKPTKALSWLTVFAVGGLLGAAASPLATGLRDQLTPPKRLNCSPGTSICVGRQLRSIDINRGGTGQIFLDASYDGQTRLLSDLINGAASKERVVLRFVRGKRITRVSVEGGRIVAVDEAPDVSYP